MKEVKTSQAFQTLVAVLATGLCIQSAQAQLNLFSGRRGIEVVAKKHGLKQYKPENMHAVVIGIDRYEQWPSLKNAANDARAMANALTGQFGFPSENVTLLLNGQATRRRVNAVIRERCAVSAADSSLIVYYSGHGWMDKGLGNGYWIPADAEYHHDALAKGIGTYLSNADLFSAYFERFGGHHLLVIADSCFAGAAIHRGIEVEVLELPKGWSKTSRWLITSGDLELVPDGKSGHSPFARRLLRFFQRPDAQVFGVNQLAMSLKEGASTEVLSYPIVSEGHQPGGEFVFVKSSKNVQTGSVTFKNDHRADARLFVDNEDHGIIDRGQSKTFKCQSGYYGFALTAGPNVIWQQTVHVKPGRVIVTATPDGGGRYEIIEKLLREAKNAADEPQTQELVWRTVEELNRMAPTEKKMPAWQSYRNQCRDALLIPTKKLFEEAHLLGLVIDDEIPSDAVTSFREHWQDNDREAVRTTLSDATKQLAQSCRAFLEGKKQSIAGLKPEDRRAFDEHRERADLAWDGEQYAAATKAYFDAVKLLPEGTYGLDTVMASLAELNDRSALADVPLDGMMDLVHLKAAKARSGARLCDELRNRSDESGAQQLADLKQRFTAWRNRLQHPEVESRILRMLEKWSDLQESVVAGNPPDEAAKITLFRVDEAKQAGVPEGICARFQEKVFRVVLRYYVRAAGKDARLKPVLRSWGHRAMSGVNASLNEICGGDKKQVEAMVAAVLPGHLTPAAPPVKNSSDPWRRLFPQVAVNRSGTEFVFVPPGMFRMGTDGTGQFEWDGPAHEVAISAPFYLARRETTVGDLRARNPAALPGKDRSMPVTGLKFADVANYIDWLNTSNGLPKAFSRGENGTSDHVRMTLLSESYRLPTEAEWEYACSLGRTQEETAWLNKDGFCTEDMERIRPNALGAYFMLGNAGELVGDWFALYPSGAQGASRTDPLVGRERAAPVPINAHAMFCRVARGGTYMDEIDPEVFSPMHFRQRLDPGVPMPKTVGFRIVLPILIGDMHVFGNDTVRRDTQ